MDLRTQKLKLASLIEKSEATIDATQREIKSMIETRALIRERLHIDDQIQPEELEAVKENLARIRGDFTTIVQNEAEMSDNLALMQAGLNQLNSMTDDEFDSEEFDE